MNRFIPWFVAGVAVFAAGEVLLHAEVTSIVQAFNAAASNCALLEQNRVFPPLMSCEPRLGYLPALPFAGVIGAGILLMARACRLYLRSEVS